VRPRRLDLEKATAYECGFDPFGEARSPFDVGFYLVAILFLVFDLEVAFLLPWAVGGFTTGWSGFVRLMLFLVVLTLGFIYEFLKGALDWN
jgi:NADH-quinone oxidoreductase subunit A